MDGEMDPTPLVGEARAAGKQLHLPVLATDGSDTLRFATWQTDTLLQLNRFNIPEPSPDTAELRAPAQLDLVFAPLVGFDANGNRLGMGGGFYDRSFAFLRSGARKPLLIGLAYEFQKLPELRAETWDVPLAGVATDCAFYRF
jgi:5-formyltetrahydrofolate cyclo-ligase